MVLLWSAVLVLAAASTWGFVTLRRYAAIGSAYKAKVLCSLIFVAGRVTDPTRVEDVSADSYWPLRFLRTRIDRERSSVTVSVLGLQPRTAFYRAGLGATLHQERPAREQPEPAASHALTVAIRPSTRNWSIASGSARLSEVVASAFTDPNPRRQRRTRAIVVVHDGRIVAERYAPGFSETTPMQGWSITKSVLGTLIGVLVGEGRLALTEHALLPEWRAPDPRSRITLEDLLRMRSGLAFSEVYADPSSDVNEMLFNRPDAALYAASRPLDAAPATTWRYSSGTTNILSAIVRRVVGDQEYLTWPRRVLFDPLGMRSAIMEPDASGTFVASSFMFATARDWARFGQLQIQLGLWEGRQIVSDEWVRFGASPTPQSPQGMYGAHWWRGLAPELGGATPAAARIPDDAFFAIGHEAQTLSIIPSRGLVVVRLGLAVHVDAWDQAGFLADVLDAV